MSCGGSRIMHLPLLSPTGLEGRTSTGNSMDGDSSGSVMGYGDPYLASGLSGEMGNNLTRDPDAAYRYVGKLNAQQQDTNGWKMDKLVDGEDGAWLAGDEENGEQNVEDTSVGEEEVKEEVMEDQEEEEEGEERFTIENKENTDNEDELSTEEIANSTNDESSMEGIGKERTQSQDNFFGAPGYLSPSWPNHKDPSEKELRPVRKLIWNGEEEGSPEREKQCVKNGSTDLEAPNHKQTKKHSPKPPVKSTVSPHPCPILCFDEYGNLTTSYMSPEEIEIPEPPPTLISPPPITRKQKSPILDSPVDTPPVHEPKALRSRTRLSHENYENAVMVSEQELQQAFKEDFNTAATSRYGRARKRKTADGFLFGTINFNELRKITGSPKKGSKGSGSKNSSPDQKTRGGSKGESPLSPVGSAQGKDLKDLNENGIGALDNHPLNGEVEVPTFETVQIDQAKDSTPTVQNRIPKRRGRKPLKRCHRRTQSQTPQTNPTETSGDSDRETPASMETSTDSTITNGDCSEADAPTPLHQSPLPRARRDRRSKSSLRASSKVSDEVSIQQFRRSSRSATALANQAGLTQASQEHHQEQPNRETPVRKEKLTSRYLLKQKRMGELEVKEKPSSGELEIKEKPLTEDLEINEELKTKEEPTEEVEIKEEPTEELENKEKLTEELEIQEKPTEELEIQEKPSIKEVEIENEILTAEPTIEDETTAEEELVKSSVEVVKEEPMETSQGDMSLSLCDSLSGDQDGDAPTTRSASRRDSDVKEPEDKQSSITKSGRIIKKPQLMDISNEDKRQKLNREQQKQNEALLNSSIEEDPTLGGPNMQLLEKEHPCQYMVGDLVWVYIRGSPLWPSMISYDPVLGQYSRVATKLNQWLNKYHGVRMYHVQFFSDNALTQWIAPFNIIPYEGYDKLKEHLLNLKDKLRDERRHKKMQYEGILKTLHHMKRDPTGQKHERWMRAITEANIAMELGRYDRIQKYTFKTEEKEDVSQLSKGNRGGQGQTPDVQQEKRKRGRPRKSLLSETPGKITKKNGDTNEGEFQGFDDLSGLGKKRNAIVLVSKLHQHRGGFMAFAKEHLESFLQENPGMSEEVAMAKLRWRWRKLTSVQGGRHRGAGGKRKHQKEGELNKCEDDDGSSGSGLSKRQRMEEEGGRGVYKVVRNEKVCCRCEGVTQRGGTDMVRCKGLCCGVFHLACLGLTTMPRRDFKCEECLTERHPCFICKSSLGPVQRCSITHCGKFYHDDCIQHWPQATGNRNRQEKFVCPRHCCHMCAANADENSDSLSRTAPFTRCLRCPTTYHTGEVCMAAGTEEISQSHHICTKHLQLPKNISHHVNVNWCFCCSKGGSLLLCDQCPAAFHAECMKITAPEGGYVCEDCENGKFPVYGDVVWVKLGLYRWWPGQVLHPRFIPDNIENLPHQQGMFCVHFFGSNDYYWVTRGRAFLYQEGDKGSRAQSSRALEMQFRRAVEEALEAYKEQKAKRNLQELRWSEKGNLKPPPYVRIDVNRPVGNVRLSKVDLAAVNRCDCEPNSENPCGSDEKCLNRMLMFECMREVCGAGDSCGNQRFQKKIYPNLCCFKTDERGWGLKTLQDIKKGEFVIEYVGELIDDDEFRRRIEDMHDVKEENYYFLTIDKDIMIDAGPKGNLARFMNHSCQPNCETQKWTVGGDTRVGLFAIEDVSAGSELTFNYNLQCVGTEKKRCCCGAPNCSGFIGVKVQKTETAAPKKEKNGKQRRKKRRRETKMSEDECFRCGSPGALILCDGTGCPKGYHLECLGLDKLPRGKWICPWHHCDECGQWSSRLNRCDFCPNSYCRQHLMVNMRHITGLGNVCQDHDSEDIENLKGQTKTTAVTDNMEGEDDHKSTLDSDCGVDSPLCPEKEDENQDTADETEEGQKASVDDSLNTKQACVGNVPRKARVKKSRYRNRIKKRARTKKFLLNMSQRLRVNGKFVSAKGRDVKEDEKAHQVNEA